MREESLTLVRDIVSHCNRRQEPEQEEALELCIQAEQTISVRFIFSELTQDFLPTDYSAGQIKRTWKIPQNNNTYFTESFGCAQDFDFDLYLPGTHFHAVPRERSHSLQSPSHKVKPEMVFST